MPPLLPLSAAHRSLGLEVEEMELLRRDRDARLVAGPHGRLDREAADERRPPLAGLAAQILGERAIGVARDLEHLLRDDGLGVDLDVREDLRAEQLLRDDASAQ